MDRTERTDAVRDGRDRMLNDGLAGLSAPTPAHWWEDAGWVRVLGTTPYIREGRDTFLSLVPARFLGPQEPR